MGETKPVILAFKLANYRLHRDNFESEWRSCRPSALLSHILL